MYRHDYIERWYSSKVYNVGFFFFFSIFRAVQAIDFEDFHNLPPPNKNKNKKIPFGSHASDLQVSSQTEAAVSHTLSLQSCPFRVFHINGIIQNVAFPTTPFYLA